MFPLPFFHVTEMTDTGRGNLRRRIEPHKWKSNSTRNGDKLTSFPPINFVLFCFALF